MADPRLYLPPSHSGERIHGLLQTLSLPRPTDIVPLASSAAFHRIYILSYPASALQPHLPSQHFPSQISDTDLILRISGPHFTSIKTRNEIGFLKWVAQNTDVPVPEVVAYDATTNNELGHEFMITTRLRGVSFDGVREQLQAAGKAAQYEAHLSQFLLQMGDILEMLQRRTWSHIGGLQVRGPEDRDDAAAEIIVPGPVIDEQMWLQPELATIWGPHETHGSVNVGGPFASYTESLGAEADRHVHAIQRLSSLAALRQDLPRILAFRAALREHAAQLNETRLILAHRDLHFGNVMWDPEGMRITGILDWEFAGVVPIQRWDPVRAFLWNCVEADESKVEKARLAERVRESHGAFLEETRWSSPRQEHMQLAINFMRAIVQVLPRGQIDRPWEKWRESMLEHIDHVCAD
ncbi:MAG: hypothetical protein M1818_001565 [Claussenomyces sp. TS43310]|nr:MAG: hypothetical protein M1818_001565 [Claussenomyces sp. TS43310]